MCQLSAEFPAGRCRTRADVRTCDTGDVNRFTGSARSIPVPLSDADQATLLSGDVRPRRVDVTCFVSVAADDASPPTEEAALLYRDMEAGKVKIAEDSDFVYLKKLVDDEDGWKLEYNKGNDARVTLPSSNGSYFRD